MNKETYLFWVDQELENMVIKQWDIEVYCHSTQSSLKDMSNQIFWNEKFTTSKGNHKEEMPMTNIIHGHRQIELAPKHRFLISTREKLSLGEAKGRKEKEL